MTNAAAEKRARELFGSAVSAVQRYSLPAWRDRGGRGFRVLMNGDTIHWMTRRGYHEKEVCCKEQHAKRRHQAQTQRPEVVVR